MNSLQEKFLELNDRHTALKSMIATISKYNNNSIRAGVKLQLDNLLHEDNQLVERKNKSKIEKEIEVLNVKYFKGISEILEESNMQLKYITNKLDASNLGLLAGLLTDFYSKLLKQIKTYKKKHVVYKVIGLNKKRWAKNEF